MDNPIVAINALITPAPFTLGQAALLEKIKSPLLIPETVIIADAIPSLYLLTLPSAEGAKALPNLIDLAFSWADTLTIEEIQDHLSRAIDAIVAFYGLMPKPDAESQKKST